MQIMDSQTELERLRSIPLIFNPPETAFVAMYNVRTYECDSDGFAQFPSICNYLQETAATHADSLGLSIGGKNMPDNLSWVLTRMRIELDRYPKWRDEVKVFTFPRSMRKLFAYRDFEISLADGTPIGRASSEWMVINSTTRRAERMPESIASIANTVRTPALGEMPFSKFEFPETDAEMEAAKFSAQRSHIDVNGHVNNVHYIEWMLEAAPEKMKRPLSFEVVFRSEVTASETVAIGRAITDDFAYFRVTCGGKESVVSRAR